MLEQRWVSLRVKGADMEKINLPYFYQLGVQLHPLTQKSVQDDRVIDIIIATFDAEDVTESLLDRFSMLSVCRNCGQELLNAVKETRTWFMGLMKEDLDKLQNPDATVKLRFDRVIAKAKEFETILSAELQTLTTYHATQKGIYDTADLIERAENILPPAVLNKIDEKVKEEIRWSGRCLAFDNATASAFHMMRATELVLHKYYLSVCKPKTNKKLENWGAYIAKLGELDDPNVKEVISLIQQIKDQHRNLIMHPEIVLAPDEAFGLFEIAKSAIIAMASKLTPPEAKDDEPVEPKKKAKAQ